MFQLLVLLCSLGGYFTTSSGTHDGQTSVKVNISIVQLHCINSVYTGMRIVPYVEYYLLSVFDFHSVHFSETKEFCEMFKIMKFCATVL